MKILAVSDTVMSQMENAAHLRRRYHDVSLLVSCGDMPSVYLEFITSVLNVPLAYVRGNHDARYDEYPPGGDDLHKRLRMYGGLSFFGLEGCRWYSGEPVQYTENDMMKMVLSSSLRLLLRRLQHGYAMDVFVAHSPIRGIHDATDLPHQGFQALARFVRWMRPRYMLHGHVHTYDRRTTTVTQFGPTLIMNINPVTLVEVEPKKGLSTEG
jgi:Icc-related predicted phosphoesterase